MSISERPARHHLALAALAGMVLLLLAVACGGGEKEVSGLVLEAVERSLTEIESLRLRDDDGRVWQFSTEGPVGTTAAHLRQHQIAGERIVVRYREVDGRLIAFDVKDAAGSGGSGPGG